MKKARRSCPVAVPCAVVFLFAIARVDGDDTTPAADTTAFTHVDADGVPLSLSPEHVITPTEALSRIEEQNSKPAQATDWLITGYEQEMLNRGEGADSGYMRISSNKQLAELAGVPYIGDNVQRPAPSEPGPSQTIDAEKASANAPLFGGHQFQPLVSPFGPAVNAFSENYAAPLPMSSSIPLFAGQAETAAKAIVPNVPDAESIETPGAVAAQQDPDLGVNGPDLTLDLLPGESPADALSRQTPARLEPPPMNADQLHEQEAEYLSPPKPTSVAKTADSTTDQAKTQQTKAAAPPPDNEAPMPVTQLQPISPVHAPISSPYSILDR